MSYIFGNLGLADSERVFSATTGQQVIYDAIMTYVNRVADDMNRQMSIFVDMTTTNHKERFKLPGTGRLQDMGYNPQAKPASVKAYGGWDVAYPLTEYAAAISGSRVSMAYMTVADLERHVQTIVVQDVNTVRHALLYAIFNSTAATFNDDLWGSLTIQRLANGDSVTYPPVIGSESEATDNHYLESNYAASAISDTNNPYVTIEAELVEHFGKSQGNDNVAVFINSAQKAKTEDLTDFVEVTDRFVMPGTQTARLTGLPMGHPGRVIGRTNGCWVIEWDWIPSGWAVGVHLDTDPVLKMRIDPADTGLGNGRLALVAEDVEYPFEASYWSHRFGFGVGNRLGAVVLEFGTGGTYTEPTAYA